MIGSMVGIYDGSFNLYFLMASDVEYLFIGLCSICITSVVKYPFISFAQFVIELLLFMIDLREF